MLTIKQIDAAKPKDKPYRLLDSNGLYLYVPVTGKKVWQLRYKLDGKEKVLTIGKYPLMSLQEARDKAWLAKKDVSVGVDPVKAKNELSSGLIEYKSDAYGNLHIAVGKVSWSDEKLLNNVEAVLSVLPKKNLSSVSLAATMSPSVKLKVD